MIRVVGYNMYNIGCLVLWMTKFFVEEGCYECIWMPSSYAIDFGVPESSWSWTWLSFAETILWDSQRMPCHGGNLHHYLYWIALHVCHFMTHDWLMIIYVYIYVLYININYIFINYLCHSRHTCLMRSTKDRKNSFTLSSTGPASPQTSWREDMEY